MRLILTIAALGFGAALLNQCSAKDDAEEQRPRPKSKSHAEIVKVDAEDEPIETDQPKPTPSASPKATASPSPKLARTVCTLPTNANSNPTDIKELIQLINSMPMPLTLPCFVDVLLRPLRLTATISNVSAQPAPDDENPRFFFFSGSESKLVLSVVPAGEGAKALEYSFLISDSESVKGEVLFPVTAPLDLDQLGKRLLRRDGAPGSTCGGCHANERVADATRFGADHFISRALQPRSSGLVSQKRLNELAKKCASESSERCDLFDAIFRGSSIELQSFPTTMPTLF